MNDFNTTNNSTFLPRGFRDFFKSRLNEVLGLVIIIFTTSIIISIWGFNPNDPIYSRRLTRAFSQIPRSDLRSIRNETTLLLWLRVMVGESPQKRRDRARSNAIM